MIRGRDGVIEGRTSMKKGIGMIKVIAMRDTTNMKDMTSKTDMTGTTDMTDTTGMIGTTDTTEKTGRGTRGREAIPERRGKEIHMRMIKRDSTQRNAGQ